MFRRISADNIRSTFSQEAAEVAAAMPLTPMRRNSSNPRTMFAATEARANRMGERVSCRAKKAGAKIRIITKAGTPQP